MVWDVLELFEELGIEGGRGGRGGGLLRVGGGEQRENARGRGDEEMRGAARAEEFHGRWGLG